MLLDLFGYCKTNLSAIGKLFCIIV